MEDQLADVKRNAPLGRRSWGGAQAPERGAVRGRTLPAPPHVYASMTPQPKPAAPAVHLAVVKPDQSGIGRAVRVRVRVRVLYPYPYPHPYPYPYPYP